MRTGWPVSPSPALSRLGDGPGSSASNAGRQARQSAASRADIDDIAGSFGLPRRLGIRFSPMTLHLDQHSRHKHDSSQHHAGQPIEYTQRVEWQHNKTLLRLRGLRTRRKPREPRRCHALAAADTACAAEPWPQFCSARTVYQCPSGSAPGYCAGPLGAGGGGATGGAGGAGTGPAIAALVKRSLAAVALSSATSWPLT
jgi:hypothetical protein